MNIYNYISKKRLITILIILIIFSATFISSGFFLLLLFFIKIEKPKKNKKTKCKHFTSNNTYLDTLAYFLYEMKCKKVMEIIDDSSDCDEKKFKLQQLFTEKNINKEDIKDIIEKKSGNIVHIYRNHYETINEYIKYNYEEEKKLTKTADNIINKVVSEAIKNTKIKEYIINDIKEYIISDLVEKDNKGFIDTIPNNTKLTEKITDKDFIVIKIENNFKYKNQYTYIYNIINILNKYISENDKNKYISKDDKNKNKNNYTIIRQYITEYYNKITINNDGKKMSKYKEDIIINKKYYKPYAFIVKIENEYSLYKKELDKDLFCKYNNETKKYDDNNIANKYEIKYILFKI